ncbi:hypothetical protein ACP4OV_030309 [Aristida adscensionis]
MTRHHRRSFSGGRAAAAETSAPPAQIDLVFPNPPAQTRKRPTCSAPGHVADCPTGHSSRGRPTRQPPSDSLALASTSTLPTPRHGGIVYAGRSIHPSTHGGGGFDMFRGPALYIRARCALNTKRQNKIAQTQFEHNGRRGRKGREAGMAAAVGGRWTRVRTLGRGASGAVVSLAADADSGALFAVKSASAAAAAAEQLRREGAILSALRSPHVLPCLGFRAGGAECQLFLEFAPGGSLADVAARAGGRGGLEEREVRELAADVARGLAYLHGRSLVHGDVKARNVVVGADGRAKLADFGCARAVGDARPIGGTPAFMAPEVARGEEQGPAADVWALGCTVLEMATGRAPWSDMDDVLAAVHRIGFTDAVPEVPAWMSPEAKDFLARCFARDPRDRWTAAELLEHPFLASAGCGEKAEAAAAKWVSPKSTLEAALWESDTDDDGEDDYDMPESPAQRIKALAGASSALPDWDSDEGWIEVLDEQCDACNVPVAKEAAAKKISDEERIVSDGLEIEAELFDAPAESSDPECTVAVGLTARSIEQPKELCWSLCSDASVLPVDTCHHKLKCQNLFHRQTVCLALTHFLPHLRNDYESAVAPTKSTVAELARCDDSRTIVLEKLMESATSDSECLGVFTLLGGHAKSSD